MLLGISTSVFASIFLDTAKKTYTKFTHPLKKALEETSIYFSKNKGISFNLNRLEDIIDGEFASSVFEHFNIETGIVDDDFALEFAEYADLYFDDNSKILTTAKEILQYFANRFETHLLEENSLFILKAYLNELNKKITSYQDDVTKIHQHIENVKKDIEKTLSQHINLKNPGAVPDININLNIHIHVKESLSKKYTSIRKPESGLLSKGEEYICPTLFSICGYRENNYSILLDENCKNQDIDAIMKSIRNDDLCYHQILTQDAAMYWVECLNPQEIEEIEIPIKIQAKDPKKYIILLDEDEDQLGASVKNMLNRLNNKRDTTIMDSTIVFIVYIP